MIATACNFVQIFGTVQDTYVSDLLPKDLYVIASGRDHLEVVT